MRRFGAGDVKENPCKPRLNNLGSIVRYPDHFKNHKKLAKLQAWLDLGESLERVS